MPGWTVVARLVELSEAALRWVLAYPLLTGQVALLLLVSSAGLGQDLGAERLFWNESDVVQASTGWAVGTLYGVVLFTVYVAYRPSLGVRWLQFPLGVPADFAARRRGLAVRRWTLFPSRRREVRVLGRFLLVGLLALLAVTLLLKGVAAYRTHAEVSRANAELRRQDDQRAADAAAQGKPAPEPSKQLEWTYLEERRNLLPHVAGYALALLFARGLFLLDERAPGRPLRNRMRELPAWTPLTGWHTLGDRLAADRVPRPHRPLHGIAAYLMAVAAALFAVLLGLVAALDAGWPGRAVLSPVAFVSLMLIVFSLVYGLFAFHLHFQRVAFGAGAALLLAWNSTGCFLTGGLGDEHRYGRANYKLRFPGLDRDPDAALTLWTRGSDPGNGTDIDAVLKGTEGYAREHLIPAEEPLRRTCERWQREQNRPNDKPKVVIVCVSGGGIRAAVWTGVVLQQLDAAVATRADGQPNDRDRLRDHVRLFTGASGGMVGATLYVADFEQGPFTDAHVEALAADSLTRTAQSLVLRDMLWNTVVVPPWAGADWDRGKTLEWMWARNAADQPDLGIDSRHHPGGRPNPWHKTFAELRTAERDGRRPSIIYSPVMVEDARRLLLSNLDLSGVNDPTGRRDLSRPVGPHGPAARSAVEFHRLFPDVGPAPDGRPLSTDFKVVTAARMNATFPVVSPAVSLPTAPPRRLVDAGIYDNYGVNLAAAWMLKNRDHLERYTSGVALVQVRAFPLHDARLRFASFDPSTGALEDDPARGDLLSDALAAVSAPAEAVLAARANAAYFRNAEQIDTLHRVFNRTKDGPLPPLDPAAPPDPAALRGRFFVSAWLELRRPAALNWYLTAVEKEDIRNGWKDGTVQQEAEKLLTWFGDGGAKE